MRTPAYPSSLLWLFLGCANQTPARIELPASLPVLYDEAPVSIGARLVDRRGNPVRDVPLTYSISSSGIASISSDGAVTCLSNGEASVLVAGGGQTATLTITCRLVATLEVSPKQLRIVVGRAPEPITVVAKDHAGNPILDAPITPSISEPTILQFNAGSVIGLRVGNSEIRFQSGRASTAVSVSVVELLKSEPLAIQDGGTVTWTLQQGDYELDLQVKAADGSKNGVTVSWVGTTCGDAREAQNHQIACKVHETASLTMRNPTTFGLGPAVNGFFNLYRRAP